LIANKKKATHVEVNREAGSKQQVVQQQVLVWSPLLRSTCLSSSILYLFTTCGSWRGCRLP